MINYDIAKFLKNLYNTFLIKVHAVCCFSIICYINSKKHCAFCFLAWKAGHFAILPIVYKNKDLLLKNIIKILEYYIRIQNYEHFRNVAM